MFEGNYIEVVLLQTGAMFLVILPGWWAGRRGWLGPGVGAALSRLVVDVAFPALVLTQMVKTVTWETLRSGWYYPALLCAVLFVSSLAGLMTAGLCRSEARRKTFRFLIAIPNWVYLPLPIVQALFGDAGVSAILLGNVGAQVVLWSYGIWLVRGGVQFTEVLRNLFLNGGLLATLGGIAIALALPGVKAVVAGNTAMALLPVAILYKALELIGSLTIPLSLLVIGMQLGSMPVRLRMPERDLVLVVAGRLILGPAFWWACTAVLAVAGWPLPPLARMVMALVALMPVALSCSVFSDRYGGDSAFAAQGIFWTTLISLITVPLGFALMAR